MTPPHEPADVVEDINGVQVLVCDPQGPVIASEADALDLVGTAAWQGMNLVVVPVARLSEDFFRLRTGLAGAIVQKFVNYQLRLAVTGDISAHLEASSALRDFVRESNHGPHLWFLPDLDAVRERLRPAATGKA
ncbi:DUF4180 domain-containing protein [Kineosporia babensis]|uniref:DUF4180 domain-containing protein n=1 Tax=Kineosporia babensis TaxID=499548 RepID=A0A9X1NKE8_9ACTN|nr:DUF4180 domain-containing protein [Kineosporia babensis]MCD5315885.1 DUF4180 domain-containing protein [Kineosporia babensis]